MAETGKECLVQYGQKKDWALVPKWSFLPCSAFVRVRVWLGRIHSSLTQSFLNSSALHSKWSENSYLWLKLDSMAWVWSGSGPWLTSWLKDHSMRPNSHRTCYATLTQNGTFFLWCCLGAVWTFLLTTTGPICLCCIACRVPRPVWIRPQLLFRLWEEFEYSNHGSTRDEFKSGDPDHHLSSHSIRYLCLLV